MTEPYVCPAGRHFFPEPCSCGSDGVDRSAWVRLSGSAETQAHHLQRTEVEALRAENARLKKERDEARGIHELSGESIMLMRAHFERAGIVADFADDAACVTVNQLLAARSRIEKLEGFWSDTEARSAEAHAVYQKEAHRRGDVRHPDDYGDLSEPTKEWDRVLVRWVLDATRRALGLDGGAKK